MQADIAEGCGGPTVQTNPTININDNRPKAIAIDAKSLSEIAEAGVSTAQTDITIDSNDNSL